MRISRPIPVPSDGDHEQYHAELQVALDRVRVFAEENLHKAGSPEFPFSKSNRDEH
jgi:hypothetical protein